MSDLKLSLRDGIWQVTGTVKIPGRTQGVRVRESAGTTSRRDAETYRDKLRQEVVEREIHGPAFGLTFAECVLVYLEKGGEKRFMSPILERFGEMRLRDITADKVTAFALERYGHLQPAGVKRQFYTPLNAALNKGTKAFNVAPMSFEAPKVERKAVEYAPREWFSIFFRAAHFRIATAVFFLTTTGARVSEMCNLTLGDTMFDHERGPRALLRKTKNGKPRVVVLDAVLVRAMKRLIAEDDEADPAKSVFGYAGRRSVNQAIKRVCTDAGIKYFSSHKLGRHAFAARLLESGGSLKEVQEAGGWASIQIVADSYGHLEEQAVFQTVLGKAAAVAPLLIDTPLTHTANGQNRKGKTNPKKPRKPVASMVGTRGIEPLTPTMSR